MLGILQGTYGHIFQLALFEVDFKGGGQNKPVGSSSLLYFLFFFLTLKKNLTRGAGGA